MKNVQKGLYPHVSFFIRCSRRTYHQNRIVLFSSTKICRAFFRESINQPEVYHFYSGVISTEWEHNIVVTAGSLRSVQLAIATLVLYSFHVGCPSCNKLPSIPAERGLRRAVLSIRVGRVACSINKRFTNKANPNVFHSSGIKVRDYYCINLNLTSGIDNVNVQAQIQPTFAWLRYCVNRATADYPRLPPTSTWNSWSSSITRQTGGWYKQVVMIISWNRVDTDAAFG